MPSLSVSNKHIKGNEKIYTYQFSNIRVDTLKHIATITRQWGYSTMIYKEGHRTKSSVIGYSDLLIFDIDTKLKEQDYGYHASELALLPVVGLVATTKSHTDSQHRLRLLIQLDKEFPPTTSYDLYRQAMMVTLKLIGLDISGIDTACLGVDRFYTPNPNQQTHYLDNGDLLDSEWILAQAQTELDNAPKLTKDIEYIQPQGSLDTDDIQDKIDYIDTNANLTLFRLIMSRHYNISSSDHLLYDNKTTSPLVLTTYNGKAIMIDKADNTGGISRAYSLTQAYNYACDYAPYPPRVSTTELVEHILVELDKLIEPNHD